MDTHDNSLNTANSAHLDSRENQTSPVQVALDEAADLANDEDVPAHD